MKAIYSPINPSDFWNEYWRNITFENYLNSCVGDQLTGFFHRFLDKDGINLEAGCGMAKWVITLSEEKYQIIGIDNHWPSLARARENTNKINLISGSVADLPVDNNSIDAYISLGVIEHFEEVPPKPIVEAFRVLKPGGIAIIETPLNNYLRKILINHIFDFIVAIKKILGTKYYFAEYRYSSDELEKNLTLAGFNILQINTKDYEQPDKSIGLWIDVPFFRHNDKQEFSINQSGQYIKLLLNKISPWICSACVVCIGKKPLS